MNVASNASHIANLNPLRYRSYFYDTETGWYRLNTRYYNPVVGRFINADSYVSTGQGFLGYNMFAYCLNNPVIYVDNEGESVTITIFGATLGIKGIASLVGAVTSACVLVAYTMIPAVREGFKETVSSTISGIKESFSSTNTEEDNWLSEQGKILVEEIFDSYARSQGKTHYYRNTNELHHIVAKSSPKAELARDILDSLGISINDPDNLILLKTGLHRRLHTNNYYDLVNAAICMAYDAGNGKVFLQEMSVRAILKSIGKYLHILNLVVPY